MYFFTISVSKILHNLVQLCPMQYLEYIFIRKLFIIYLRLNLSGYPLFLFAKSGNLNKQKQQRSIIELLLFTFFTWEDFSSENLYIKFNCID